MKIKNKRLQEIGIHAFNRLDYKYWDTQETINFANYKLLKEFFFVINGSVQTNNYSTEVTSVPFIRIGDIDYKFGISLDKVIYLDEDSIISEQKLIQERDLILATIGATVGKVGCGKLAVGGTHSNNTVILRPKTKNINIPFYEKLFQTDFFIKYLFGLVSQKAQPNLQSYEIANIKIPIVSSKKAEKAMLKISDIEAKIENLKKQIFSPREIMDLVFSREFNINISKIQELELNKTLSVSINSLFSRNDNMRFSSRWNKAAILQNELKTQVKECKKLDRFILETKNGWSPLCNNAGGDYQVLGIDSINIDTHLSFHNPKFSSIKKNNLDDYQIKDGDFFISRGNTVDLVSLASVARVESETPYTIFPDLMIRVRFLNDIDVNYMAYIFNSFIGRFYFKYVTKGKNQTMVKVTPKELGELIFPCPVKSEQQRIVNEIQREIAAQDIIKSEIGELRNKIDNVIIESISEPFYKSNTES